MRIRKCYHCGKGIERASYKNIMQTIYHENKIKLLCLNKESTVEVNYDLCDDCYDDLLKWLDAPVESAGIS